MIGSNVLRVTLALAGIGLCAPPLGAQRAGLERVEELVRLGRADEARGALLAWWDGGREDASRQELQRGLWLRGRLTVDPVQAGLDFQRLAVLYPRGSFTPRAILRLAQAAYEMGDEDAARRHVATLVRDHANAPARQEAETWLRAAGPVPPASDAPPVARAGDEEPEVAGPEPTTPPGAGDDPDDAPPAPRVGTYFVQLGAFAEEARALALFEEVTAAGVEVRVVRVEGSRFLHVRFGRFVERADAVEQLEALAEAGMNAALVRDERAEVLVRN